MATYQRCFHLDASGPMFACSHDDTSWPTIWKSLRWPVGPVVFKVPVAGRKLSAVDIEAAASDEDAAVG